jgi:hypothetical protein
MDVMEDNILENDEFEEKKCCWFKKYNFNKNYFYFIL